MLFTTNMLKKVLIVTFAVLISLSCVSASICWRDNDVKPALMKMLTEYFFSPDNQTPSADIRDLYKFYNSMGVSAECSVNGDETDIPIQSIMQNAEIITFTVPICADGTEYGRCTRSKPKYCEGGEVKNKCTKCGCPESHACNNATNSCYALSVTCNIDANCGTNGYVGNNYCMNNDVYRNYNTSICLNPMTTSSYCISNTTPYNVSDCPYGCTNGVCNAAPPNTCTDNDGGLNYNTTGTVSGNLSGSPYSYTDSCLNTTWLKEYYCSGSNWASTNNLCTYGCSGNKCSSPIADSCSDSDGGQNYYLKGFASGYKNSTSYNNSDICLTSTNLKEYYCSGTSALNITFVCSYNCSNGACINATPNSCSDTDGGINYSILGTVSGNLSGSPYSYTDSCLNSIWLKEYYCSGSYALVSNYTCSNGCLNGICSTTPILAIAFSPQTTGSGSSVKNISVNTSITGSGGLSSFIDFNRSLVGYWNLNNDVLDKSNYGNDGTIYSALRMTCTMTTSGNSYLYEDLTSVTDYVIQSGDYLEYDVYWTSPNIEIAFDYTTSDNSYLRGNAVDQNGLGAHPNVDLTTYVLNQWYHRKIPLPASHQPPTAKTITNYDIACENDTTGTYTAYLDNIVITDGAGNIRKEIYMGAPFTYGQHLASSGTLNFLGNDVPPNGWMSGRFGSSFNFDGKDDYIDFGTSSYFNLPTAISEITIEAWIKTSAVDAAIVTMRNSGNGDPIVNLQLGTNGWDNQGTGKPSFSVRSDGNQAQHINGLISINDNSWHHVAATRNSAKEMRLYVDGTLAASGTDPLTTSVTTNQRRIGDEAQNPAIKNFNGTIDEVRIWKRALSEQEIKASYNSQLYRLERNFTNLNAGTYEFYAYVTNQTGEFAKTETRTATVT